jgi:hypothetical protein
MIIPEGETSSIKPLTQEQVEKFRLLLSTYQDGTGRDTKDRTLPGWEDFEDVSEIVFEGERLKGKSAFDIIVPGQNKIGISCKMTKTLKISKTTVLIEHSRINAEFFNALKKHNIPREKMFESPEDCGNVLLSLVKEKNVADAKYHEINLASSFFLVMAYDVESRQFKLFQFPIKMPRADKVTWSFNSSGKHLRGVIGDEIVLQWFHEGGGQLKYYPGIKKANWISDTFTLEPIEKKLGSYLTVDKVKKYFKEKWNAL